VPLLRLPQPYDFELSTGRYRAFGPDLANLWHDGALYRVVDGREVRIVAADGGVEIDPAAEPPVREADHWRGSGGTGRFPQLSPAAEREIFHLLGGPFDLDAFYRFVTFDPVLARIAKRLRGLRPPLAPTPFESLVTSITAQQVSLRAAFAIRNRLIERFGDRPSQPAANSSGALAFPTRDVLAAAREEELVALGFSRRKAAYVVGLARSDLDLEALAALPDEEVKARLTTLPGIGEWTADWFLARHLARARAWPAGDLGLRKAVSAFYGDDTMLSPEEVRTLGARFEPFQNLTAHYLLTGFQRNLWT
jgi:3-methyladenine DNA glycosylase/8-oxoguanine DNA glycosylase